MPTWAILYAHTNADSRLTASVAIIPAETAQKADEFAAARYNSIGYRLLYVTRFPQ